MQDVHYDEGGVTGILEHLLDIQPTDGGSRCNTCSPGRCLVTDASTPGATSGALDALRCTSRLGDRNRFSKRCPIGVGPCFT